jgi:predicted amidophosphoribosyltransferase
MADNVDDNVNDKYSDISNDMQNVTQLRIFMQGFLAHSTEQFKTAIKSAFGHQHCYLCHQHCAHVVCHYCINTLVERGFGQHRIGAHDLLRNSKVLKNLDTPNYDHLHAIDNYVWPINTLVLDMKFAHKPIAARVLAMMFMRFVFVPFIDPPSVPPMLPKPNRLAGGTRINTIAKDIPQLLVPVPLSNKRYWHRQYNQAQLLCDWLSKATQIPNKAIVQRVKHTAAQTALDKQQRITNVENAFECGVILNVSHIAIIDDVITTGVTINAVCRAIKICNPNVKISVWAMAITLLN